MRLTHLGRETPDVLASTEISDYELEAISLPTAVSAELAREKLLRAAHEADEDAKEDVESAGMSTATVEIVNEARRRADEQGHPTMLRHLLEALRASGGICEEVIAKGDLGPLERKLPKLSPGEPMSTTPYRMASRRADVYTANNDVTPMNVVIDILANVFALSIPAAVYACREAHYCGFDMSANGRRRSHTTWFIERGSARTRAAQPSLSSWRKRRNSERPRDTSERITAAGQSR